MRPRRIVLIVLLAGVVCFVRAETAGAASGSLSLTVEPERVAIGLFYSGVDLAITAETEPGCEVAVVVSGPSSELVLRQQERRWGLLWAPGREVVFEDVPGLYLVQSTVEPEKLAPARVLEELGIGYASLRARLGSEARGDLVRELIALKEAEGLFSSTVRRPNPRDGQPPAGVSPYRTVVHVPAQASPSTYSVRVCAFRDGHLASRADGSFALDQAGSVGFVSSLARSHGLAYGVFAVVVAVAAGLLVGFLFGSTRKRA
jgi:uncharacterized protein (TIGR02186 family)